MRTLILLIPSLLLAISACKKDDTPTGPADSAVVRPSFVGRWQLVKNDGNAHPPGTIWTFQDTTLTVSAGSYTFGGSYAYDSTPNPKTVDIKLQGVTPNPNLAIYRFDDTTHLTIKLMDGAQIRATNFSVESGYDLQEFLKQ